MAKPAQRSSLRQGELISGALLEDVVETPFLFRIVAGL
jgi:hypothetical protein